jgi:predicted dehydrogenase
MAKIRMGFIGCGSNGSGHVGRCLDLPDVEVAALCDISEESLARCRQHHPRAAGIPAFADFRAMLAQVPLDAVQVSTPHTLHFEHIMGGLEAGAHVLTEKPMVCTVAHAEQVITRARALGRTLMIAYQRHLMPQYRFVRNQIAAGELGQIQFVSALQDQGWLRGTSGTWRQEAALSGGGQINDSGSHLLDVILWMTGLEAQSVQAYMEHFGGEVDINSALSIRFRNGAMGNLSIVGNSPVPGMWEDFTIWGSKAVVYMRQGKLTIKEAGANEVYEPAGLPGASTPDRNFVDALLGRDAIQVPPICGLRVIELSEAAWCSARTGRPAKVRHSAIR